MRCDWLWQPGQSDAAGLGTASILTQSIVEDTRVTLKERGTKDSKAIEDKARISWM